MTIPVETRTIDIQIKEPDGTITFEKKNFEVPKHWGDRAATIAASKYAAQSENSVLQIINRVVNTITDWGTSQGYFNQSNHEESDGLPTTEQFKEKLTEILIDQRAAFNSPVWFNLGVKHHDPQAAACFILPVEDNMESILDHAKRAGLIFKGGSGVGVNISKLRAKKEKLSNGGETSGSLSFIKIYDSIASSIKSGGKVRRAAALFCMDDNHPDLIEFIQCKTTEERKAKQLMSLGYSAEQAYSTVSFQNANHSIVVTDKFMEAVQNDHDWLLINRGNGKLAYTIKAKDLLAEIAKAAWETGDPGILFDTRINADNPVTSLGKIKSTNPCQPGWATVLTPDGVKTFNDIDVGSTIWSGKQWTQVTRKVCTGIQHVYAYRTERGTFYGTEDHQVFSHGYRVRAANASSIDLSPYIPENMDIREDRAFPILYTEFVSKELVYDITVDASEHSYWTDGLLVSNCAEYCSVDYGSCNLASLNLLKYYDTDIADDWNGTECFDWNKFAQDIKFMIIAMDILIEGSNYPIPEIREMTLKTRPLGLGFTNLGALLIACLLPYDSKEGRQLAKSITKFMSQTAYATSEKLGKKLGSFPVFEENKYRSLEIAEKITGNRFECLRNSQLTLLAPTGTISLWMDCDTTGIEPLFAVTTIKKLAGGGTLELPAQCIQDTLDQLTQEEQEEAKKKGVFKTANEIHWKNHIAMMAACQPHLSGSISKTVNISVDTTPEEIMNIYCEAWKLGIKAISVYRDGSKQLQPLSNDGKTKEDIATIEDIPADPIWAAVRKKLPDTRQSVTHKFDIQGFEGYITVGLYEDGQPGELFINTQKQGSTLSGMMDAFATCVSISLQYGVPLYSLITKFQDTRFEPAGFTKNEDIRMCTSIMDYIFKWLELEFSDNDEDIDNNEEEEINEEAHEAKVYDGPPCRSCGGVTQRAGTCWVCSACGETTGCS